MTLKIVILTLLATIVACQENLSSKYDNVELDPILKNDRLLKSYIDCLLEKGKCTPQGEELKKRIPESLENDCAQCTDKQKAGIKKVFHYLVENKKDWWSEVVEKFDPEGKYRKKYENFIKKEGITL